MELRETSVSPLDRGWSRVDGVIAGLRNAARAEVLVAFVVLGVTAALVVRAPPTPRPKNDQLDADSVATSTSTNSGY